MAEHVDLLLRSAFFGAVIFLLVCVGLFVLSLRKQQKPEVADDSETVPADAVLRMPPRAPDGPA